MSEDEKQPIIIKKVKKGGHGHHGGAWKIAYADFVTAMMAFFLLMWLLNMSTKEQLTAIADYFDPSHPKISRSNSGAGGVLGGLSVSPDGSMSTNKTPLINPQQSATIPKLSQTVSEGEGEQTANIDSKNLEDAEEKALREELRRREEAAFQQTEEEIRQAIQQSPELAELAENLMVEITPEGLRIQIIDKDGESMFPSGSAQMYEKTRKLMMAVADIIKKQPNDISIRGHTDAFPFRGRQGYSNWELSADRANASRRVLGEAGIAAERFNDVIGKAATDPLIKEDPFDAKNRRISIVLLRDPDDVLMERARDNAPLPSILNDTRGERSRRDLFRQTPGDVEFP